ncbi:hypothetical protein VTK26DRAFT_1543 [Humicola hyalothermophila]
MIQIHQLAILIGGLHSTRIRIAGPAIQTSDTVTMLSNDHSNRSIRRAPFGNASPISSQTITTVLAKAARINNNTAFDFDRSNNELITRSPPQSWPLPPD